MLILVQNTYLISSQFWLNTQVELFELWVSLVLVQLRIYNMLSGC
jgi:hypothetical protein